ncbi:hypothetical protein SAMN05444487_113105 [Marininema mesophilum]|uniref:Uncharacterized protein n=1 Tax=Marininema mesophilum TaxID=1048340 RepID=A0A1H3ALF8_9BACL|nr:hypothetical protein [Marininema mesophilum]SDX29659.1 hypothetical protein SAMN05444487_113105 [Marininema mesophilum]
MTITVGVYLGKKDRFLRNWYDILPRGQFPLLVKYCIQSYLKGVYFPLDTICDRGTFRERMGVLQELSPTQRNVTFTKEDGPIFDWVDSVDNGYRSEEIKSILKETIIHTLLEEPERAPLAHQTYRRRYGGHWQDREGAAALEGREGVPERGAAGTYMNSDGRQGPIRIEELYGVKEPLSHKTVNEVASAEREEERPPYTRWVNR